MPAPLFAHLMAARSVAVLLPVAVLAGCATPSENMRIGTEQTYVSLADQRDAIRSVAVVGKVPAGSAVIGGVDASRCHRYQGTIEPTPELVEVDLKVAAYARGADGIAEVSIVKQPGLQKNCWTILTGRAVAFKSPPPRQ